MTAGYQLVGGSTNERLKATIHARWGIRSLVRFDRQTRTVHPYCTYKYATVAELRETIRLLEQYPMGGTR